MKTSAATLIAAALLGGLVVAILFPGGASSGACDASPFSDRDRDELFATLTAIEQSVESCKRQCGALGRQFDRAFDGDPLGRHPGGVAFPGTRDSFGSPSTPEDSDE